MSLLNQLFNRGVFAGKWSAADSSNSKPSHYFIDYCSILVSILSIILSSLDLLFVGDLSVSLTYKTQYAQTEFGLWSALSFVRSNFDKFI